MKKTIAALLALVMCFFLYACGGDDTSDTANVGKNETTTPATTAMPTEPETEPPVLTIKDIIDSDYVWRSEGGIANSYGKFIFDCENMKFLYEFESSQFSNSNTYSLKFIDEKTVEISGLRSGYSSPAELTVVNANRLKIRFLDDELNNGDYYLNKTSEVYAGKTSSTGTVVIENDDDSSLTEDEERLLKYLKNSIDSFKNPASVRVVEVYAYDEDEDVFYVDISAENSLGGNTLELYEVSKNDIHESMTSRSMFEHITIAPGDPCSCDVSTINNLLKEYYLEMGWD